MTTGSSSAYNLPGLPNFLGNNGKRFIVIVIAAQIPCKFFVNSWGSCRKSSSVTFCHGTGADISLRIKTLSTARALGHWFTGLSASAVNPTTIDRAHFCPSATKKRWYRRLDEDDDHDVSHTPTGRLRGCHREEGRQETRSSAIARAEGGKVRRCRGLERRGCAGFGHAEVKKRKAEEKRRRRSSSPGRRRFPLASRLYPAAGG